MLTLFDSVNVAELPEGDYAYAGYTSGLYPTLNAVVAKFPGKTVLSIAVTARGDAQCLDIERGDATNADAPAWVQRQIARGTHRPVLYTSVSNVDALMAELSRASVRLWSAHYGAGEHICGPTTCRLCNVQVDGTQWDDHAMGRNLDQSVLADDFFQQEDDMAPTFVVSCPTGGYWEVRRSDGGVYAWAGAPSFGSMAGKAMNAPVAALGYHQTNGQVDGYWLLGADGGVFAFGAAPYTDSYAAHPEWHNGSRYLTGIIQNGGGYNIIATEPNTDPPKQDVYDLSQPR